MIVASLFGKALYGFYYMIPFLPYRTMRDHFIDYPLGENVLTILIIAVIIGALLHGKRLPKSKLYTLWFVFGVYLYISLWIGTALGNAPAPLWFTVTFMTWKAYMLIPLIFVAASLVVEDRKAVRMVIILTAITVLFIDRSSLSDSMSHTWANFDENKRGGGPLAFGSNQTAAYLANFVVFFWGMVQFIKRWKFKIVTYFVVAVTMLAAMYCFSRAGYLSILFGVFVLGVLKDRKLLLVFGAFLLVWQSVVPTAVRERINMTHDSNGQLEASAQERVDLWENAERSILHSPIVGSGFATFQLGEHVDNLSDTHNWYVKVMVETGIIGLVMAVLLLQQMLAVSFRLFRRATDPLYRGLGLGLFIAVCSCIVGNFFGDRWTYIEITGPLWVLVGAAIRANQFMTAEMGEENIEAGSEAIEPYMAYH